jgi:hypothetical protein
MLTLLCGRERTADRWRALLGDAGFDVERLEKRLIVGKRR